MYLEEADVDLAAIWIVVHRVVVWMRRGLRGRRSRKRAEVSARLERMSDRYVLVFVGWC